MSKKRCLFCRQWYEPYPSQAARQLVCGRLRCKRKLKRTLDRAWRRQDPRWRKDQNAKVRAWAARRKYWSWYRGGHPAYRDREIVRMRRRRVKTSQNRNDDLRFSSREGGVSVAKQEFIGMEGDAEVKLDDEDRGSEPGRAGLEV